MLDSRPRGPGFEPHRRHCILSLSKNIDPSLVLVQPRRTRSFVTERLLMGLKESNQTKQNRFWYYMKDVQSEYIASYRIINKFINKKSVNKLNVSAIMKTQSSMEDSGQTCQSLGFSHQGSMVECSTRDRRAAGSSLTCVTALWSLSKTHLS